MCLLPEMYINHLNTTDYIAGKILKVVSIKGQMSGLRDDKSEK